MQNLHSFGARKNGAKMTPLISPSPVKDESPDNREGKLGQDDPIKSSRSRARDAKNSHLGKIRKEFPEICKIPIWEKYIIRPCERVKPEIIPIWEKFPVYDPRARGQGDIEIELVRPLSV